MDWTIARLHQACQCYQLDAVSIHVCPSQGKGSYAGIDFVEKEYLIQCLAEDIKLPPGPYRIHLQLLAQQPSEGASSQKAIGASMPSLLRA